MCGTLPLLRLSPADGSLLARALGNVAFPITVGFLLYLAVHALLRSPELAALRRRRGSDGSGS